MEDIEKAIKELRKQYEYAKENLFVRDPLAYALYKTWKKFDEKRLKRADYERGEV